MQGSSSEKKAEEDFMLENPSGGSFGLTKNDVAAKNILISRSDDSIMDDLHGGNFLDSGSVSKDLQSDLTPSKKKRRSILSSFRSIPKLIVGEQYIDLLLQVVCMEDVVTYDKKHKSRTVVGSDGKSPPSFIQLSAWDKYRDAFAVSTSTQCLNSSFDSNFSSFMSLMGKTVLFKSVSVVGPPKDQLYNLGNVEMALSYKDASAVTILADASLIIENNMNEYFDFLLEFKFNLNGGHFCPVTLKDLKKSTKVLGM